MSYQTSSHGWRTFLIVWITQSISVFGSASTAFAITLWLTTVRYPLDSQKQELAFAISAVSLCWFVPQIFSAPIAGAWADRRDRKTTMLVADALSGCVSLILLILIVMGTLQLWMLLLLLGLAGVINAFHDAAFETSYVILVPKERLPRANGLMETTWALSSVLSPGITATLVGLPALSRQGYISGWLGKTLGVLSNGVPLAIALDIATFLIASGVLLFLIIPSPQRTDLKDESGEVQKSIWSDIQEGIHYIRLRRGLFWLLGISMMQNLLVGMGIVIQPLLGRFNLAVNGAALGFSLEGVLALMSSVASLGGLVGGAIISSWGGLKGKRVYGMLMPMMMLAITQIVLGLSVQVLLSVTMLFCAALVGPIFNAHSKAIWQAHVRPELQGRVFSVRRLISQFTGPLGMLIAGVAAGVLNPGLVLAVMGIFHALFGLSLFFNLSVLHVEDQKWIEERAI